MQFDLVFENTGDSIPFEVVQNHQVFSHFVDHVIKYDHNSFSDGGITFKKIKARIDHLHWALSKSNSVLYDICGIRFKEQVNLDDYLDQDFLNRTHHDWVKSQSIVVDISTLCASPQISVSNLGWHLHSLMPDDCSRVPLAEVMAKLGLLYPYEQVNLAVHDLEGAWIRDPIEFNAASKYKVFDNPFWSDIQANNNVTNFFFGYTFVGRQYYNKFEFFDTELKYDDHYNYETLECSFHVKLARPETCVFSPEFQTWAASHDVPMISTQLPVANVRDLEKNMLHYRQVLYRNSCQGNSAQIVLGTI